MPRQIDPDDVNPECKANSVEGDIFSRKTRRIIRVPAGKAKQAKQDYNRRSRRKAKQNMRGKCG